MYKMYLMFQITVILAVSLTAAAKAQYQLQPATTEQQAFSYPAELAGYIRAEGQYEGYPVQQPRIRSAEPAFETGARSSTTFDYGQRRIAVQVNHHESEPFVNNYNGHYVPQDFKFNSIPGAEVVNQFVQDYRPQTGPVNHNNYNGQREYEPAEQLQLQRQPYTLVDPALQQPTWDPNAYNLNIRYEGHQPHTTPSPPPPRPPPPPPSSPAHHDFQYNNDFVPRQNFFGPVSQRNLPVVGGYDINNLAHYGGPPTESTPFAYNPDPDYGAHVPRQYEDYRSSIPGPPRIRPKELYFRPSQKVENSNFIPMINRHKQFHTNNEVQTITEFPNFESSKIVTKQKLLQNYTSVAAIGDGAPVPTPPTTGFTERTAAVVVSPVVQDLRTKVLPTPTVVQPTKPSVSSLRQHFNELVTVADYSALFRSQSAFRPPQQTTYHSLRNSDVFVVSKPHRFTTPSTSTLTSYRSPGGFVLHPTLKQFGLSDVYYGPTTVRSVVPTNALNEKLPAPNVFGQSTDDEINNPKKETLFSVNGYVEHETTTDRETFSTEKTRPEYTTRTQETGTDSGGHGSTHRPVTNPSPGTTAASPPGQTTDQVPSDRNTVFFSADRDPANDEIPATETSVNGDEKTSPSPPVSESPSNRSTHNNIREESEPKRNTSYKLASSTTPSYKFVEFHDEVETEPDSSRFTDATEKSTLDPTRAEKESAKRRKKVRIFKKPISSSIVDSDRQVVGDRTSKNVDELENVSLERGPVDPIKTKIHWARPATRGRYHATIPQKGRSQSSRTVHRTGFLPTVPQPESDNHDYSEERPISPTAPQHFLPTVPRTQTADDRDVPDEVTTYHIIRTTTALTSALPSRTKFTPRPFAPAPFLPTIIPEEKSNETITINARELHTTYKTIVDETEDEIPTTTIDSNERISELTTSTEPVRSTFRSRTGTASQRGQKDSERQIYSLNRQNLNGRLRVISASRQENTQPLKRRQNRYHDFHHQPQRQVVRKIIVKPNKDREESGSFKTSGGGTQSSMEAVAKPTKESSVTVRNSVLFPRRKPLRSRFSTTTTTEKDWGITTASYTSAEIISTETADRTETADGAIPTTDRPATESRRFRFDTTTTKFTGKRQIETDPDVQKLVEDSQNLREEDNENIEEKEKEAVAVLKEINKNANLEHPSNEDRLENEYNENDSGVNYEEGFESTDEATHEEKSEESQRDEKAERNGETLNTEKIEKQEENAIKENSEIADRGNRTGNEDDILNDREKHLNKTQQNLVAEQTFLEQKDSVADDSEYVYEKQQEYIYPELIETETDRTLDTLDEPMSPEIVPSVIPQVVSSQEPSDPPVTRIEIVTSISEMRQVVPNKLKYDEVSTQDII